MPVFDFPAAAGFPEDQSGAGLGVAKVIAIFIVAAFDR